ncbi:protein NYNRIN-like [Gossypium australe]|uniref:Protein NYNRIN-like n=1 Tax=Gossypium australe TaxID=47621 RepID=A0A5B6U587_9ROSI|nr:protein NYNRIN-like [Gossypium australe]
MIAHSIIGHDTLTILGFYGRTLVVYVDGSTAKTRLGTGTLVVDPDGNKWQYGLSLGFQTSNNTTKYEELISKLQLARHLRAKDLTIHTDS